MLKKIVHIGVIVLLLISTMGVTMYKHYCDGSLMSESIGLPAKKCCNDSCKDCHSESKTFKITDNYEASNNSLTFKADVQKLFDNFSLAFVLLQITFDSYSNNDSFALIKSCDTPPLIAENQTAMLQVFRL
ncbi:MAG: hypothetical protein U0W24_00750 [Bacteroidales bacterium]